MKACEKVFSQCADKSKCLFQREQRKLNIARHRLQPLSRLNLQKGPEMHSRQMDPEEGLTASLWSGFKPHTSEALSSTFYEHHVVMCITIFGLLW